MDVDKESKFRHVKYKEVLQRSNCLLCFWPAILDGIIGPRNTGEITAKVPWRVETNKAGDQVKLENCKFCARSEFYANVSCCLSTPYHN